MVFIHEVGFVWRQLELAFFGAVTLVAALLFLEGKMEFNKKALLTIVTCVVFSLLSYAIGFLAQIGIPPFLIGIINVILSTVVFSLILKRFFRRNLQKNHSWRTYIPPALIATILCNIAIGLVGNIPYIMNVMLGGATQTLLNVVVKVFRIIICVVFTFYSISVIEKMNLDHATIKEFLVIGFTYSSLNDYVRKNKVRIVVFFLVLVLLILGAASWMSNFINRIDIGFDNERLTKCSWCDGKGKEWKGAKGWLPCDHCGGTGKIGW